MTIDTYYERTDRNIGWITPEEQEILRHSVVGIAGVGGMGGLLASILVRTGIGEVRISDCESFDMSNCNRQFGATRSTIGKSKVIETARMLQDIADDAHLVLYPDGITEQSVDQFISGCSVVCDEIEAFALDARILLHARAREHGVSLFNCNSIGLSTNLFLYTPGGVTFEEMCGISYDAAKILHIQASRGDKRAAAHIGHAILKAVVPMLPEYRPGASETDHAAFYRRYIGEQKVPIIGTNPPMATGFLANRILLYLLRNSGVPRDYVQIPEVPGFLHFDAAHMRVTTK